MWEELESHFDVVDYAPGKRPEEGWVNMKQIAWRLGLSPGQVKRLAGRIGLDRAMTRVTDNGVMYEEKAAEASCRLFVELRPVLVRGRRGRYFLLASLGSG